MIHKRINNFFILISSIFLVLNLFACSFENIKNSNIKLNNNIKTLILKQESNNKIENLKDIYFLYYQDIPKKELNLLFVNYFLNHRTYHSDNNLSSDLKYKHVAVLTPYYFYPYTDKINEILNINNKDPFSFIDAETNIFYFFEYFIVYYSLYMDYSMKINEDKTTSIVSRSNTWSERELVYPSDFHVFVDYEKINSSTSTPLIDLKHIYLYFNNKDIFTYEYKYKNIKIITEIPKISFNDLIYYNLENGINSPKYIVNGLYVESNNELWSYYQRLGSPTHGVGLESSTSNFIQDTIYLDKKESGLTKELFNEEINYYFDPNNFSSSLSVKNLIYSLDILTVNEINKNNYEKYYNFEIGSSEEINKDEIFYNTYSQPELMYVLYKEKLRTNEDLPYMQGSKYFVNISLFDDENNLLSGSDNIVDEEYITLLIDSPKSVEVYNINYCKYIYTELPATSGSFEQIYYNPYYNNVIIEDNTDDYQKISSWYWLLILVFPLIIILLYLSVYAYYNFSFLNNIHYKNYFKN